MENDQTTKHTLWKVRTRQLTKVKMGGGGKSDGEEKKKKKGQEKVKLNRRGYFIDAHFTNEH